MNIHKVPLNIVALAVVVILVIPCWSWASVIAADTVWQGEVAVSEDVVVPRGVTLTVRPGTTIKVASAESTKTDPEYMSPLTEITVRGVLKVEGTEQSPVVFQGEEDKAGSWAGIINDAGIVMLASCCIRNAETGVSVFDGLLQMEDSTLRNNRYGITARGEKSSITVRGGRITENDYGVMLFSGARIAGNSCAVDHNRKRDTYSAAVKEYRRKPDYSSSKEKAVSRQYRDEVLLGDTIWEGRIEVDGIVRVPEGSRLIIMPGAIVEFRKKDTNGDGIGENALLIQGLFIAKGTRENPIIFRSAERNRAMGDWDAINIMNSDGAQNLVEYCQIEDAYRGLHFHFSNVLVSKSILRNSYRGIQFQESNVEMTGNHIYGNKNGIQGRDSEVVFSDNLVYDNVLGANFFRVNLTAKGNSILNNYREGLKVREGRTLLENNLIDGNRYGLMVADSYYGYFDRNVVTNNGEIGFSMKNSDNIEVLGNYVAGNGLTGLNIQDVRADLRGNQFSDNGERGIGIISFTGTMTGNNFASNGLYHIDLEGAGDVAAPSNWWSGGDLGKMIHDKADDPARGRVSHDSPAPVPFPFVWPLKELLADSTWRGEIVVEGAVTTDEGTVLSIAPKTRVRFADNAGLTVNGKLLAVGGADGRIVFTSVREKGPSDWGELLLEHANGSRVAHAVFKHATWGIHSHFTNLSVSDSLFTNNYGGMRFRSGPVEISRSAFEGNSIGIRSYIGNAVIRGNTVTRNEIGIFVREKGGSLRINRNNIFANSSYNIRLGDFNDEDVDAVQNWWGDGDPLETMFDGRKEPGIGTVLYEPFSRKPVGTDGKEGI